MSYSETEIRDLTAFANRLADTARLETLPRFRQQAAITNKENDGFDPVTDADRMGEKVIRELIADHYPDHGIVGEEFGAKEGAAPFRWVLDPVDGTRAYICGAPSWVTLIALEYEGRPILGLIDQPHTDERWLAVGGATLFHCGGKARQAKASDVKVLNEARISTTDPRPEGYFSENEASLFRRLANKTRVARFSLDAYAYGLLALGELDIVVESTLSHHDYAALTPVIEGAGGVASNWSGDAVGSEGRGEIIAAATPQLHEAALKVLQAP